MLRLEMFFTNVDNLMPGLQNLWRAVRRFLLSGETLPRLLISKAVTVVLMCVMSVTKCAYLFDLSVFRWAMFTSSGTVSSNMWNLLFTLSQRRRRNPKDETILESATPGPTTWIH